MEKRIGITLQDRNHQGGKQNYRDMIGHFTKTKWKWAGQVAHLRDNRGGQTVERQPSMGH